MTGGLIGRHSRQSSRGNDEQPTNPPARHHRPAYGAPEVSEAPQGLKIGDRVRMRSGGPLMCVEVPDIPTDPRARCRWFDEAGHLRASTFPIAMLQVIEGAAK